MFLSLCKILKHSHNPVWNIPRFFELDTCFLIKNVTIAAVTRNNTTEIEVKNLLLFAKHPSAKSPYLHVCSFVLHSNTLGCFLLTEFDFFNFYKVSSCYILFTDIEIFLFSL